MCISGKVTLLLFFIKYSICAPPDLSASLPGAISIYESASPSLVTSLLDMTVTDPDGDNYVCSVSGASSAFVTQNTAGTTEKLYLQNNPGFEHDTTPSYTLTLTCTDINSEVSTGTIAVNILSNTPPAFSGLPSSVNIGEREILSQTVYTLTVADADPFTCQIDSTSPAGAPFSYQSSPSRVIVLNSNPGLNAGTTPIYTIVIKCSDSYGFSTGTLTVNVVGNSAPTLSGLPTAVNVLESVSASSIYTLTVSDPEGDPFTCSILSTPSTTDFYLDTSTNKVMVSGSHTLEYDTQSSYAIAITCNDGKTSSGILTINVQPNSAPVISSLPIVTVTEGESGGRVLTTLTVTDAESDSYTCNIVTTGPFSISGLDISVDASPTLDHSTTPSYAVSVTCNDAYGSTTETLTVNVNANAAPVISDLPRVVSVAESDSGGSSIYVLTVTDTDSYNCIIQGINPTTTAFSIVYSTQYDIHLNSGHGLDFDTVQSYAITIACTDSGSLTSTGVLTVSVTQNTPPVIQSLPDSAVVTATETSKRKLHDLTVTETDPYTCTMLGGGPFSLESEASGYKIYLDAGASSTLDPSTKPTYTLTVTCSDPYASSSGIYTVSVSANASPTISNLPDSVNVAESDAGGATIFTVTVTDTESDSYSCSIQSIAPSVNAFQISKNGANYDIILINGHALEYDTAASHDITVECTDYTTSTGVLTVIVASNAPPGISSLPAIASVTSGETVARTLHTLAVTDTDPFVCTMTNSAPTNGPFALNFAASTYTLDLNSNPSFGGTSSYTLTITCSDSYGSTSKDLTVSVNPNTDPVITSLPVTTTVSETETAARCLHTVLVTDADGHVINCNVSPSPAGPFEMQQDATIPEYKVCLSANAIATLDAVTTNTHTITVTCTDSAGGSTSGDVIVTVTADNPPTITLLPDITEVSENLNVETKVWDLTVSDPETDTFTCALTTVPSGPFDLRKDAGTGLYAAYLLSTPNLNYSITPSYSLTFTCTDAPKGRSSANSLTVNIVENRPPQFDNTPYTATPNAMTTTKNDVIFTVATTDLDLDTVLYSMDVSPVSIPPLFSINTVSGEISATSDLKYELTKTHLANVTATDGQKTSWELVTIDLQNINTDPIITNMVLTGVTPVYIPETTAAGSTLFTATVYDPDSGQTQSLSIDVSPFGMTGMFSESNKVISLAAGKTFNYETLNYYRLSIYVSDTYAQTGPYYLAVNILDEPEDCVFPKTKYEAHTHEGGKASVNVDLGLLSGVSDEDSQDPRTYSLVNSAYSSLFNISSTTGVIYYAVDYDIDTSHPQNLSLIVKCTDKHGLSATATVSLYVEDINDNAPDFTRVGYVFYVNQYTSPGAVVGTITASDKDQHLNAEVEYSGSSATGTGYYTVAKNGKVILTKEINFEYGQTHRFKVVAVDHGTPQLTGTSWVDIVYREITTTTPTTTTSPNTDWWSKPENVAMVAILSAIALLILGLLLYLCIRAGCCGSLSTPSLNCCKNCCKHNPSRNIKKPENPKPEKFKLWDVNDLNKKRDPFSTSAQKEMESVPAPMVL